jgi:succinyl-diaminopimelate desuccinylase
MKGSIAAMVTASQRFVANSTKASGSLGFLMTSDEEGPAINGTRHALAELQQRSETIKWCIVGEPTSRRRLGDTIKNGRRGSLNGVLNIYGVQGHVAYPKLADNPIHRSSPLISELTNYKWDDGSIDFPPTSFQISNINSGTGALNVIPGDIRILFNFRFSPESTVTDLQNKVEGICKHHCDHYTARDVITRIAGIKSDLATDGGTSDGRFIAQTGAEVIELGPVNDTIHSAKERVRIADLTELSKIYEGILNSLLG